MSSTTVAPAAVNASASICASGYIPAPTPIPSWAQPIVLIILTIVMLATLLGNLLVIIVIAKYESMRTKITNWFIMSLAFADFFVAIFVMPFAAAQDLFGLWPFGHYCSFWVSLDVMLSTASILNLLMISIERYIAVTKPFHYEEIMTPKVCGIMISVAWVASAVVSFVPIMSGWYQIEGEESVWVLAIGEGAYCKPSFHPIYATVSSFISFWIPTFVMIGVYSRVFQIARRQAKQIAALERTMATISGPRSTKKSENRAMKTMALVMGVFVACWMPFFLLNCIYSWDPEILLCKPGFLDAFLFFIWLGWINSSFNFVIYSFNPSFKRAYRKLLCCGRQAAPDKSTFVFSVSD